MAGELSDVGSANALDALTGRATQTARTTYLALLTAAPGDTTTVAGMAEVTTPGTNGYARQAVAWTTPSGSPPSTSNSTAVTFGTFTADLGSVTHCALVSAQTGTGGQFLFYWTLSTARDPAVGDSIQFGTNDLSITFD